MTGSEVGRVLACPASEVLPHTREEHAYSNQGTDKHRDAEVAAELGDLDALPPRVAQMLRGAAGVRTEFVMAYDVAEGSARVVPGVVDRAYPPGGPFEIFMRLDLLVFHETDAIVIDHKLYADQGTPLEHGQLMTQALAVARAWNLSSVRIAISYLGTGWVDGPVVADWMALDDHADRLRQLYLDVAAARRSPAQWVRPGQHCRYCPAFWNCPAHAAALAARPESRLLAVPPLTEDADARRALELLEQVSVLYNRLKTGLHARAADRPIPLGDGRMWGPVTRAGNESLDGATVYQVAQERYGREHAASFIEANASKTKLDEALKALTKRGAKAEAKRSFLADVRARGGASRSTLTEFTAYKPQLQLVAPPAEETDL